MMAGMGISVATWYPIFMLMESVRPFVDAAAVPLVDNPSYSPVVLVLCVFVMVIYVVRSFINIGFGLWSNCCFLSRNVPC